MGRVPPLVVIPDPPIKNTLQSVLGLITVVILERLRRSIFFKATSLQHVRLEMEDGNEVAKSLMVFNLRRIIHPFQSKKYLRT